MLNSRRQTGALLRGGGCVILSRCQVTKKNQCVSDNTLNEITEGRSTKERPHIARRRTEKGRILSLAARVWRQRPKACLRACEVNFARRNKQLSAHRRAHSGRNQGNGG